MTRLVEALTGFTALGIEVLTQSKRAGNAVIEREYYDLLLHGRHFELISIDLVIAEQTAAVPALYALRAPDVLQLANACSGNL
jgi:hypothetical protein